MQNAAFFSNTAALKNVVTDWSVNNVRVAKTLDYKKRNQVQ